MPKLICPYCGDEKTDEIGCCGESRAHFEEVEDEEETENQGDANVTNN